MRNVISRLVFILALITTLLAPSVPMVAQGGSNMSHGDTLPARCRVGDTFMKTTAGTNGVKYSCKVTDVWTVDSAGTAATSEAYLTVGNTSGLSAERAIIQGTGVTVTDGGANSTLTIAADGPNITGLSASNLSTGTVAAARGGAGTVNGILKANGSGAVSQAVSATDYAPATSGSAILKGNGAGGFSSAASGTDYAPATSGSLPLFGNGSGGFTNGTVQGNTTKVVTYAGSAPTTNDCAKFDANGNVTTAGAACGAGAGTVTNTGTLTSGKTIVGNGSADITVSSLTANLVGSSSGTLAGATAAANSKLLGSGSSGSGAAYSEITLGTNLTMTGTTLDATGGSSGPTCETHAFSGASSQAFTTFYSSSYKTYNIEISGLTQSVNDSLLYMQVSSNGGSTWAGSGIYFGYSNFWWAAGAGGAGGNGSANELYLIDHLGNTAGYSYTASLVLKNIASTSLSKFIYGRNAFIHQNGTPQFGLYYGLINNTSTAYNALQFYPSSGTFSGTISVCPVNE